MEVDELIRVVDLVLRCGASASIPSVAVTPRQAGAEPAPGYIRPRRKPAAAVAGGNDSVMPELM